MCPDLRLPFAVLLTQAAAAAAARDAEQEVITLRSRLAEATVDVEDARESE